MLLRYLTAVHNIWLGLHFKDIFDIVEKIDRGSIAPLNQKSQVALRQNLVTSPAASEEGTNTTFVYPMSDVYNKLPATAFTKCSQYLPVLISSTTSIEVFLSETDLQQPGNWAEWVKVQRWSLVLPPFFTKLIRTGLCSKMRQWNIESVYAKETKSELHK